MSEMIPVTAPPSSLVEAQQLVDQIIAETKRNDESKTWMLPRNPTEAEAIAKMIAGSGVCPQDYRGKWQDVFVAMVMGAPFGFGPLQSCQNIAVINGRPTMWGDMVMALALRSLHPERGDYIHERDPQECQEAGEGRCEISRSGIVTVRTFTRQMAQTAGLYARAKGTGRGDGPWITYEGRMLQMRARGWAFRDALADVLKGLWLTEEARDIPADSRPVYRMPQPTGERTKGIVEASKKFEEKTGPRVMAGPEPAPVQVDTDPVKGQDRPGEVYRGPIEKGTERYGKTKGREWSLFQYLASDGRILGTFDTAVAGHLNTFCGTGEPLILHLEKSEKGNWKILEWDVLNPAPPVDGETEF